MDEHPLEEDIGSEPEGRAVSNQGRAGRRRSACVFYSKLMTGRCTRLSPETKSKSDQLARPFPCFNV